MPKWAYLLNNKIRAGKIAIAKEGLSFRLRMQNGGENAVDSIFNFDQTKCCIIFINSKVAGEYKTI